MPEIASPNAAASRVPVTSRARRDRFNGADHDQVNGDRPQGHAQAKRVHVHPESSPGDNTSYSKGGGRRAEGGRGR